MHHTKIIKNNPTPSPITVVWVAIIKISAENHNFITSLNNRHECKLKSQTLNVSRLLIGAFLTYKPIKLRVPTHPNTLPFRW